MVINLTGVLEDGSDLTPRANVPLFARKTLRLVRGADASVRVELRRRSGSPFTLAAQQSVVLTVRLDPTGPVLLQQAATITSTGLAMFAITVAMLRAIDPIGVGGRWIYDVALVGPADARDVLVQISYLEMAASPTVNP